MWNTTHFPNPKAMIAKAHSLGLKIDWCARSLLLVP